MLKPKGIKYYKKQIDEKYDAYDQDAELTLGQKVVKALRDGVAVVRAPRERPAADPRRLQAPRSTVDCPSVHVRGPRVPDTYEARTATASPLSTRRASGQRYCRALVHRAGIRLPVRICLRLRI